MNHRANKIWLALLLSASALLAGCANAPKQEPGAVLQSITMATMPVLSGKAVLADLKIMKKTETGDNDKTTETKEADRTKYEDMYRGLIFEDARIQLKTNDQFDYFEQAIRKTISGSSAKITADPSKADFTLHAVLTYGPQPAPAYRDYNLAKSLGISLVTLGLGPRSWSAVVDYQIELTLQNKEGDTVMEYSNVILTNSEEMKSAFNFSRFEEVQQLAMETFVFSLSDELGKFAAQVNKKCTQACS